MKINSYLAAALALISITVPAGAQLLTEKNDQVIRDVELETEIVVCGGGLSGVCAAVSAARFIFDSDLKVRGKYMRKLEGTTYYCEMPSEMVKDFHVEVLVGKEWKTVAEVSDNWRRLCTVSFDPVSTKGLRIVVDSTWGAAKAHVFAFDAI